MYMEFQEINTPILLEIQQTGATTGTHLHLGIRINNDYVNPLDYF